MIKVLILVIIMMSSANIQAALIVVGVNGDISSDSTYNVNNGDSFSLDIYINNTIDFAGFDFKLLYDFNVLEASKINGSNIFGSETFELVNDISIGSAWFAESLDFFAFSPLNISNLTPIASINFTALDIGESAIDLSSFIISDFFGNSVGYTIEGVNKVMISNKVVSVSEPPSILLLCMLFLMFIMKKKMMF